MTKKILIAPRINNHHILPSLVADSRLVSYLLEAGFLPILLPISTDLEVNKLVIKTVLELIPEVSGVIIQGGKDDIDSSLYTNNLPQGDISRDKFELEIVHQAMKQNKSVFGICRGMQMINVAMGGTLLPDLKEKNKTHLSTHQQISDYTKLNLDNINPGVAHEILISKNSDLYKILGNSIMVNSVHHQAVDRLGQGLFIDAVAPDGVVEIISHESHNILGVQFHPEFDLDNNNFKTIISYWLGELG